MSLVAPLFLLGLAAIALPLWLHRQRVRNARQLPFSSAMLLEPQDPRLHVRRQWRYLLLLALRILLLAALAAAFAQPVWQRHAAAHRPHVRLALIVLDTSMSMGAERRFARAQAEARRLIDELAPGERAQLVSAADVLSIVTTAGSAPTTDHAALRAALARLRPGMARLDDGAVMAGLDALLTGERGDDGTPVEVHFISDFQASGTPTRFADLLPVSTPQRPIVVQLHPIVATGTPADAEANWAINSIRRSGADLVVTVRGYQTPPRTLAVSLDINGRPVGALSQSVPAAGEAQFVFHAPLLRPGDNRVVARLAAHDALAADDLRWAVIRNAPTEPVPLLTGQPEGRAVTYLSTALTAAAEGYAAQVQSVDGFDARVLPRYRWVLVDDLGAIDARVAAPLRSFLQDGGAVFAALGPRAGALDRLPLLGDALRGSAGDADMPLTVGQIDASQPLLAGLRGWEALSIEHLLSVKPQAEDTVLVGASNGDPLLLERRMGRGRVVLYTSDLQDDWNDLPVQPLFVGLLAQAARVLGGRGQIPTTQTVGGSLALGTEGGPSGQLIDPSGRTVLSLAESSRALTVRLEQTGFYQIYTPGAESLVAVNPDPLESDLTPMSAAQLARWRGALAAGMPAVQSGAASADTDGGASGTGTPLAPMLLAALVLLVLGESALGNHSLRRGPARGA